MPSHVKPVKKSNIMSKLMNTKKVAMLGGSGFVGSVIANRLSAQGIELNILTRRRDSARKLWPVPNTTILEIDPYNAKQLRSAIEDADAVINLVGILNEKKDDGLGFRRAHVELTQEILSACKDKNVTRYLHMSALNADSFAPSYYLRTKGEAENAVLTQGDNGVNVTIFRPSLIFGRYDGLFNRFKQLLQISPVLPSPAATLNFNLFMLAMSQMRLFMRFRTIQRPVENTILVVQKFYPCEISLNTPILYANSIALSYRSAQKPLNCKHKFLNTFRVNLFFAR